jgi:hypothetical protein
MKKIFSLFSLLLILFIVLSCELPENIHIKGNPKLKFAAGLDFSEEFREMMRNAFYDGENDQDNLVILDCTNDTLKWMTFLIRVGLVDFDQEITGDIVSIEVPGNTFTLPDDVHLIQTSTTFHFSEFGKFLKGFNFGTDATNKIESSLFIISSDALFDNIKINLDFVDSDGEHIKSGISNGNISNKPSGINLNGGEYKGVGVPTGGVSVDVTEFFNNEEDIKIKLDVFLEKNTEYPAALLEKLREQNKQEIDVELVMWLPLFFEAGDAAEFNLPGFEDLGEFLYSLTADSDNMIKSLKLEIGLDNNPFQDGAFIVRNTKDEKEIFKVAMDADAITFDVRAEDIDYINGIENKDNFITESIIKFSKGAKFGIPRTLKIMSIAMEAGIEHTISFGGGE